MNLNSQVVGNVGLYFTCYHLSLRGWNVMPTARNARGVDLIAYDENVKNFISIQVKTLSKRYPVPLGKSLDKIMGDYWVIINQAVTNNPTAYIMLPQEIKNRAHRGVKEDRISYWLQPKDYEIDEYRNAWHLIKIHSR